MALLLDAHGSARYHNPNMELVGKVVVVTGASMGIGEAIAKLFAREGASVVLLSRDAGRAEAARLRIGCPERTVALSCDKPCMCGVKSDGRFSV